MSKNVTGDNNNNGRSPDRVRADSREARGSLARQAGDPGNKYMEPGYAANRPDPVGAIQTVLHKMNTTDTVPTDANANKVRGNK